MTHKKIFTIKEKMIMLLYADEAGHGDRYVFATN